MNDILGPMEVLDFIFPFKVFFFFFILHLLVVLEVLHVYISFSADFSPFLTCLGVFFDVFVVLV